VTKNRMDSDNVSVIGTLAFILMACGLIVGTNIKSRSHRHFIFMWLSRRRRGAIRVKILNESVFQKGYIHA
jgi:hypothetical protein